MTRRIHVTSLDDMPNVVAQNNVSHVISVLSREQMVTRPDAIALENHLRLSFNDVHENIEGFDLAKPNDISRLIEFSQKWHKDSDGDLLVHCWLGVSRAPACCYIMSCALQPKIDEMELAQRLRAASPICSPNPHLVELADYALNRGGRMVDAIAQLGRGADYEERSFFIELETA